MVESFDVFDTLLTRGVSRPPDLFLLIGRRLSEQHLVPSAEEYCRERMAAERRARESTNREEVILTDIYRILARTFAWKHDMAERAMKLEITCERETLVPVAATGKMLEDALNQKKKVFCISDTYLPGDFILERLQAYFPIDSSNLYVSSEVGLTKHSGNLFSHISEKESIKYDQWRHYGDNPHSDVRIPRRLGIESKLIDHSLTRYEASVSSRSPEILARTLSGCMRATRLSYCFDSAHYKTLWELSCNVIAPTFFGFCYWILSAALRDGVQRLYFVSRDGQILLKISKAIQKSVPEFSGIECRYLYGSRQAWHLPSVSRIDAEALDWIFANTSFLSVDVILDRLRSTAYTLSSRAHTAVCECIPEREWSNNLTDSDRGRLRRLFEQNRDIHEWIRQSAEHARNNVRGYFEQEGLMEDTVWAMVDIGWGGNLQNSLSRILSTINGTSKRSVRGYYWGLRTKTPYHPHDKQTAFAEELTDRWKAILFYHTGLYEMFASADHGSTIGYDKSADAWVPVLRGTDSSEASNWGVQYVHEAAVAFSRHFLRHWKWELPLNHYTALVMPVLEQFFHDPDVREVACFEAKDMYECQTEAARLSLAPGGARGRAIAFNWLIGRPLTLHGVWLHGVIAKQPFYVKALFKIFVPLRQIISSVHHAMKRFRKAFVKKIAGKISVI